MTQNISDIIRTILGNVCKCILSCVLLLVFVILHFFPFCNACIVQRHYAQWPSGVVARDAGCCTEGPGFESRVKNGCKTVRPWTQQWLCGSALKTGRREVPGSIPNHACQPSHSEFPVVFSKTLLNSGYDHLDTPPHGGHTTQD